MRLGRGSVGPAVGASRQERTNIHGRDKTWTKQLACWRLIVTLLKLANKLPIANVTFSMGFNLSSNFLLLLFTTLWCL